MAAGRPRRAACAIAMCASNCKAAASGRSCRWPIKPIQPIGDQADARGPRLLALPALANAHDHARTFRSATLGAFGQPLESWLPFLGVVPGMDPYLCAATSFARSVRHGVANLMVHYTRVQGGMAYADEAAAVARAARDVGVRIGFAIAMRDRHGIAYCDDATVLSALRPGIRDAVAERLAVKPVAPAQQLALVDEVARMVEEGGHGDHVTCSTARPPCSGAARRCSRPSRGHRPTRAARCTCTCSRRATSATGPMPTTPAASSLSRRHRAADAAPHARALRLGAAGRAGADRRARRDHRGQHQLQPGPEVGHRAGARDAQARLPRGHGPGRHGLRRRRRRAARDAAGVFAAPRLGLRHHDDARTALGLRLGQRPAQRARRAGPGGRIEPGAPADMVLLDWDALDDDALFAETDPLDLLLARANGSHIAKVLVGGRVVVDGAACRASTSPRCAPSCWRACARAGGRCRRRLVVARDRQGAGRRPRAVLSRRAHRRLLRLGAAGL
jgi:5-methylthioadenosine/S-adenosylhomocysteine deaminase